MIDYYYTELKHGFGWRNRNWKVVEDRIETAVLVGPSFGFLKGEKSKWWPLVEAQLRGSSSSLTGRNVDIIMARFIILSTIQTQLVASNQNELIIIKETKPQLFWLIKNDNSFAVNDSEESVIGV